MNIDWKWLLIGGAFALFVLPMLMGFIGKRKSAAA